MQSFPHEDLYCPPTKKRRLSATACPRIISDSAQTKSKWRRQQPLTSLFGILPNDLVAYILQYCCQKDFFTFWKVSFDARQISRNPSYKRMMHCHAFLDRFHDYAVSKNDSCELMPYHVTLRFFNHETKPTSGDADLNVEENKEAQPDEFLTPVALRTPVKHREQRSVLSPKRLLFTTPPRSSSAIATRRRLFSGRRGMSSSGLDVESAMMVDDSKEEESCSSPLVPSTSRTKIERPFRQLRHLIHTLEFEFSDEFWKDIALGSNMNFLALFCNAERLVIYDSERGRSLDSTAFEWPKCKATDIAADAAILHTYAMNARHLFPKRIRCETWGDLAMQAEFVWNWSRQSIALGYETKFEIDVEVPRIMTHGYINYVSRMFKAEDFPFVDRFSTNFCNNENATWNGVLVVPCTHHVLLRYEHTNETQQWERSLDFHQCACHSIVVNWDIKWCKKASNARFMVKFLEAIGDVLWGSYPEVSININNGDEKKVRAFLSALVNDLAWINPVASRALRNISFNLNLQIDGVANEFHKRHLIERVLCLCARIEKFGVVLKIPQC